MGNRQFKCPAETTYGAAPMSCVMACPHDFELRVVDGAQRCVNKDDPEVSIHLIAQAAVPRDLDDNAPFTINSLKDSHPDEWARYTAEADRFEKERGVAVASVDHDKKIAAAAKSLQTAAPGEATAAAKAAYMELTGDPDSVAYQLDQSASADARKAVDRFISDYQFLANQGAQQQSTLDLINSVKDNLFTVKDDMEYSVGTFDKQVNAIRDQINMNKRKREQAVGYGTWLSMGLNIAIVLSLVFAVFVIGRKALGGTSFTTSSELGAPTRAPATPETAAFFDAFLKHITPASATPAKRGWLW
jgi:hypothetical protein